MALISALLFSFSPLLLWFKSLPVSEVTSLFFILMSFVLLFFYKENNKIIYLILSFLIYGLSLLVRFSNLFFLPVFLLAAVYILYTKRKLMLSPLFVLFAVPLGFYVFIISTFINRNFPISHFFALSSQHAITLKSIFNLEMWVAHIFYGINGFTLTCSITVFCGVFILLKRFLTKKDRRTSLELIMFSVFWCSPSLFYYTALAKPILRYEVNLLPILVLLASLFIINLKPLNTIYLYFIVSTSIFFDLLINYFPISEYYYGNGLCPSLTSFLLYFDFSHVLLAIIIISAFLLLAYLKKIEVRLTLTTLVLLVMILHSILLSTFLIERTHYMQSIASWYGENIPAGSTIIAGQEASFDSYFAPSSTLVEYRGLFYKYSSMSEEDLDNSVVINKILESLNSGKSVFISSDRYLWNLIEELKENFHLKLKKSIPATEIRNQYDPVGAFMNYASLIKSEEIYIYEVTKKS